MSPAYIFSYSSLSSLLCEIACFFKGEDEEIWVFCVHVSVFYPRLVWAMQTAGDCSGWLGDKSVSVPFYPTVSHSSFLSPSTMVLVFVFCVTSLFSFLYLQKQLSTNNLLFMLHRRLLCRLSGPICNTTESHLPFCLLELYQQPLLCPVFFSISSSATSTTILTLCPYQFLVGCSSGLEDYHLLHT